MLDLEFEGEPEDKCVFPRAAINTGRSRSSNCSDDILGFELNFINDF
jgi:hypothetical protein